MNQLPNTSSTITVQMISAHIISVQKSESALDAAVTKCLTVPAALRTEP